MKANVKKDTRAASAENEVVDFNLYKNDQQKLIYIPSELNGAINDKASELNIKPNDVIKNAIISYLGYETGCVSVEDIRNIVDDAVNKLAKRIKK